jgi:large subunit ribosomal protein L30
MGPKKSKITVKQIKSSIGKHKNHRATLLGLGLKKINSQRTLEDTPCVRGMINKVSYMVEVVSGDN